MSSVVHFEIIGTDPERLRQFYRELFDWQSQDAPVAPEVSDETRYGFIAPAPDASAVAGGIGGGAGFTPHTIFYIGVDDVEAALARAQGLGGTRVMGPATNQGTGVVVGHLTDPEGNLVGVAGPR
jgi:predicted enzyme related to lactoylglutathione lyase